MSDVVVVNEKDEVIGTMPRAEAHSNGTPHRISIVYLENRKDEILVQVRASGFLDHSSAGHVDPGETYYETAVRELREELGVTEANLVSIGKGNSQEKSKKERHEDGVLEHRVHFFEIFACRAEPGRLAPEEVKEVYWAKAEEVFNDMKSNPLKYSGGFHASLPIYLKWKVSKSGRKSVV
jgi:isopentenyl-diphosphate Delta-isomerase